ncbi:MAG: hypothetical protein FJY97_04190 [candidate division Zixibacteria bacterium]|nr:hypothetical protein [candidate division Zixibacteria bacterium]
MGDVFYDDVGFSILTFGDGDETNALPFRVTSYSIAEYWMVADMVDPADPLLQTIGIRKTYFGAGPFTVLAPNCCRIGNLNQRANIDYFLEMDVYATNGNQSPIATQVPIVVAVEEGSNATFPVPAIDGDGDVLQWRFASDREAIGFGISNPPPDTYPPNNPNPNQGSPPKMRIDPNTGIVTWNTLGLNTTNLWTVQFMVEDWTAHPSQGGTRKGKVPVDFLLRILPRTGQIPVCHIEPMGDIVVTLGTPVTFTISGTDSDPGEVVTIQVSGLPADATMTPILLMSGVSGLSSVFNTRG